MDVFLDFSQSIYAGNEGVSVRCVTAHPAIFSDLCVSDTVVFNAVIYSKST